MHEESETEHEGDDQPIEWHDRLLLVILGLGWTFAVSWLLLEGLAVFSQRP